MLRLAVRVWPLTRVLPRLSGAVRAMACTASDNSHTSSGSEASQNFSYAFVFCRSLNFSARRSPICTLHSPLLLAASLQAREPESDVPHRKLAGSSKLQFLDSPSVARGRVLYRQAKHHLPDCATGSSPRSIVRPVGNFTSARHLRDHISRTWFSHD